MSDTEDLQMYAYYYSFEPTGCRPVDEILSAVARAGKAYHHTGEWNERPYDGPESCVEWVQNAANRAAAERAKLEELLSAAVSFSFGKRKVKNGSYPVFVELRGDGKWAVTDGGFVLASDGEWELEPLPSNRDDEFIARTRYSFDEAVWRAKEVSDVR